MELDVKIVIALNMYDLMLARGDELEINKLSKFLEIPIIKTVGNTGEGISELLVELIHEAPRWAIWPRPWP